MITAQARSFSAVLKARSTIIAHRMHRQYDALAIHLVPTSPSNRDFVPAIKVCRVSISFYSAA